MTMLATRKDLGNFLNLLNLKGEGVELGVDTGEYSRLILTYWQGSKLHLVDAWEQQDRLIYNDGANHHDPDEFLRRYEQTHKKFLNNPRVKIHKKFSEEAAKQFDDNSLDFIYFDANHSFTATYEDICNWSKKVKDNGVLCGHDYTNSYAFDSMWFGVKYAVDRWAKENNYQVYVTWENNDFQSWYIFKNRTNLSNKKILLLSGDTRITQVTEKVIKNHQAFADSVGCDYRFCTENKCNDRAYQWNKIKWISENQNNYDWVIWVDADVVFMHSRDSILNHINDRFDFISAIYNTGNAGDCVNAGIMLLQSTNECKDLIDLTWNLSPDTKHRYPHEEKALMDGFQPLLRPSTFLCSMDIFNNHPGPWYKHNASHYHITSYHKNRDAIMLDFLNMSEL